jgi:hypothetical protein
MTAEQDDPAACTGAIDRGIDAGGHERVASGRHCQSSTLPNIPLWNSYGRSVVRTEGPETRVCFWMR